MDVDTATAELERAEEALDRAIRNLQRTKETFDELKPELEAVFAPSDESPDQVENEDPLTVHQREADRIKGQLVRLEQLRFDVQSLFDEGIQTMEGLTGELGGLSVLRDLDRLPDDRGVRTEAERLESRFEGELRETRYAAFKDEVSAVLDFITDSIDEKARRYDSLTQQIEQIQEEIS